MIDNTQMKNKSIRTKYNIQYKKRIRRVNSKPNISRTKILINDLTSNNEDNNQINNNYYKKQFPFINNNPPEENSSFINKENSHNILKNDYYNTKRVIDSNYQEPTKYKKQLNNYNTPKDEWSEMLYHPNENKNLSNKIINSKTYESNIFPSADINFDKIRHIKETKYSDRLHKTQITTLPGCIKRGKYDIKDDKYFGIKNTESYLYKVEHDFNSNVHLGLYKEKENFENNFPVEQRYQGSYHKGVKDNDIFNLNNEEEKQNGIVTTGKKYYKNNNAFKSQIVFV